MLVISLLRVGKKNQPVFRIVVTDKKNPPRGGRFLEVVGFYNPVTKEKKLKAERIKYWLSVGAKPSVTVHNLLVAEEIIEEKKIPAHKRKKEKDEKSIKEPVKEALAKKDEAESPKKEEKLEEAKPEKPKKEERKAVSKEASLAPSGREEKPKKEPVKETPAQKSGDESPKEKEPSIEVKEGAEKSTKEGV